MAHARAILEHGYPLLPTGLVDWSYAISHYLMALGLALFTDQHVGARVFSALAGAALIPAFYCFNRVVFRSRVQALAAAVLIAFMSYHIAWSRQARGYALLQLLVYLAMALWVRFLERRGPAALVLALVAAAAAAFSHRGGYIAVVFMAVAGAASLARDPAGWRGWLRRRAAWAGAAVAAALACGIALCLTPANVSVSSVLRGLAEGGSMDYAPMYLSFVWALLGFVIVWAAAGAAAGLAARPALVGPLLLACLAYVFVICRRTDLFHLRYLLPVLPLVVAFAAHALDLALRGARRFAGRGARATAATAVAVLFLLCVPWEAFTLRPMFYYLGFTEPQPDWRRACRWVARDHESGPDRGKPLAFVSAFPEFADIYLRGRPLRKVYLACSLSGRPEDTLSAPLYTIAEPLADPAALRDIGGYIVLDPLGLDRLADKALRDYLRRLRPTCAVPGPFPIWIWKVRAGPIGSG